MKVTEAKLLDALELFQYSYRFRHSLFLLLLDPSVPLTGILTDLKLLQSSHISVMLVCRDYPELQTKLGSPVIVENKPGAGGRLSAQFVKNAPASQPALLIANPAVMVVAPGGVAQLDG